ncbi:MAG: purine-nucleoside phosphorylase [Desulfobacterales bacterium]|jgi:purine-nucleoside phosphorylase
MNGYKQKVDETAEYLRERIEKPPYVGLLTGTGLADCTAAMDIKTNLYYGDIPNFPISTVQSHAGKLLVGNMQGCRVMALKGRFHLYEGYTASDVTFPIRVMQKLGIRILILTNAAGGLNPAFKAGDIMIITDHINLTGANPLIGPNEDSWGLRFPDMIQAYDKHLAQMAVTAAGCAGIQVRQGVYAGLKGPSLETPAEVRFLKTIGAEAVGFSTVQEVIAAVHAGMRILGLSTITNINDPDNPLPATVEDIIAVAKNVAPMLEKIIQQVVENIHEETIS